MDTLAKLKEILSGILPETNLDSVCAETRLDKIEGLSSLNLVLALYEVEAVFGIVIDHPEDLVTVGDVMRLVPENE
ncbi:MAG: hypothetical protein IJX70_05910 [Clostridia bacterium]|nr:hypothetical protein [Clostridia bacterium]